MTRTDGIPSPMPAPASLSEAFDWRSLRTWAVFLGFAAGFGAAFGATEIFGVILSEDPLQLGPANFFVSVIVGLGLWLAVTIGFDRVVRKGPGDPAYLTIFKPDEYGFAWLQRPQDYLLFTVCYGVIVFTGSFEAVAVRDALGLAPELINANTPKPMLWVLGVFSPYFFIPLLHRFAAKRAKAP